MHPKHGGKLRSVRKAERLLLLDLDYTDLGAYDADLWAYVTNSGVS
jgi:hypothetical protein